MSTNSEDPVSIAPDKYKTLFENDRVRVLEVRLKPREGVSMHWHPDNVAYDLTPSRIKFTLPDGTSEVREKTAGGLAWSGGEWHATENVGDSEGVAIIFEMKK